MADVQFDISLKNVGSTPASLTLFSPTDSAGMRSNKYSFATPYTSTYPINTVFTLIDDAGTNVITLSAVSTMQQVINLLNELNAGTFSLAYNDSTNGNVFYLLSQRNPISISIDNVSFIASWYGNVTTYTDYRFQSVHFINQNIGWACGTDLTATPGKLYKTIDGGVTWIAKTVNPANVDFFRVHFIDANNGLAFGNLGAAAMSFNTTDGGDNWTAVALPITAAFPYGGFYFDSNNAWACGIIIAGGLAFIQYSNDGGLSWTPQTLPIGSGTLRSIFFVDALTGWAVGYDGTVNSVILKTTDGGANWIQQVAPAGATDSPLFTVFFLDTLTGWAVGEDDSLNSAVIFHTTDGGANWTQQSYTGTIGRLYSIHFIDANNGWVCGVSPSSIRKTSDGGVNWVADTLSVSITNKTLLSVYMTGLNTGSIVGYDSITDDGTLLRYST